MSYQPKILVFAMRVSEDGFAYRGYIKEIPNTLEAKQQLVGGLIQCVPLNSEIDLLLNDEGKLLQLPPNRFWVDGDKLLDVCVGNIFCCRHEGEHFTSIQYSDIPFILEHLLGVMPFEGKIVNVPEIVLPVYIDLAEMRKVYYKGRKLRLAKDIDDPYTPKKKGDIFTVDFTDDIGNIHGSWESGGHLALIFGEDEFEIIE